MKIITSPPPAIVFSEKFDYLSDQFKNKLVMANNEKQAVNIMFNEKVSPEALCLIEDELNKYANIPFITLTLTKPQSSDAKNFRFYLIKKFKRA